MTDQELLQAMSQMMDQKLKQQLSPIRDEIEEIKEEIPLERIGKTEDIAKCVKWLIEDNYTTGQIISVNGGWAI